MAAVAGPWKGLWIRRGYDPRTDPTSHKYQAVEYRLATHPVPYIKLAVSAWPCLMLIDAAGCAEAIFCCG